MANNSIKGLTVMINGDATNLGKALEGVNQKSRDLSQELGRITKQLKLDPSNADLMAQKQKVLAEAVANTSQKLDTLRKAEQQVQQQFERGEVSEDQVRALQREIIATTKKLDGYEKAAKKTADAVEKMGKAGKDGLSLTKTMADQTAKLKKLKAEYVDVVAVQGKNSTAAKKLEGEIKDLSSELKTNRSRLDEAEKAADEAAGELDDFADSAEKAEKSSSNLCSKLGGVLKTGLAAVAIAAAAAAAALGKATIDAAAYADEILTQSSVTGIATDDLQAYHYAAELVDVDVETLTKSMAKNIKSMKSASDGSKQYADAYKQLGVSVTDANGNMRDGETVYWEAIDALGKMKNETERDALAMQLFGKSAQELNPLIEAGAGKMKELTQEAKAVGAVMSEESLNALGAFDDSLQRLKGSAGAAKNSLGSVLLPELQALTDEGTEFLNEFTQKLNASGGGLEGFVFTVDSMAPEIASKISGLATQLLDKVTSLVPSLVKIGMGLVTNLTASLISMLPQLVDTGVRMIVSVLDGLTSAIPRITQALIDMAPKLVSALVSGAPLLIQGALQLLLAVCDAIPLLLPSLISALPQIIVCVVSTLVAAAPQLIQGALQLLLAICDAVPLLVSQLLPLIPDIVTTVISGLLACTPQLIQGALQLFMAILTAVPQIIGELVKVGPELVIGLVKGIIQGIPKAVEGILNLGKKILDAIKDFFGVHSPSTVFADIGKSLIDGLVNGVKNIGTALWSTISGAITKVSTWGRNLETKAKETGSKFLSSVVSFFTQLPGKVWSFLSNVISKVTSWGSSLVAKGKAAVQKLVTTVTNTVKQLPSKVASVGGELVKGLWQGISNSYAWLKDKIKGWVGNVTEFLKSLFGIHSPSKVTAWMGEMLDEGFAKGIEDNTKAPLNAMSTLSEEMLDEAGALDGMAIERQINHAYNVNTAETAIENADMIGKLDQILRAIEKGQILVIDGDKLVGATYDRMDAKLGQKRILAVRGAV